MTSILWDAIVGLVAGALAKWIMPGNKSEPGGCIMTIVLGIAGAVLVGFLMETLMGRRGQGGLIASICGATIGAILIIFLMRKLSR